MKIVVLGGGGFVGSAVVDRLLMDGHEVRVFERLGINQYRPFFSSEKVEWVFGDITNINQLKEAVTGMDAIVHLVSTTLPKNSNDNPIYDVSSNLITTLQLLDVMVAQGIGKIVFVSSGGTVYGNPQYLPIDEKHPTEPNVSYGITKLAIEKFLLMYQRSHGIKAIVLRVANPYGERQRVETAQGAIGVFIHKMLSSEAIDIYGDGSIVRDYIYVKDVADAFARAIIYDGSEVVFNISTGVGTSLTEMICILEGILGRKAQCVFYPSRKFDVPASILSNTLANTALDWKPLVSLEQGIAHTVDWMKKMSK